MSVYVSAYSSLLIVFGRKLKGKEGNQWSVSYTITFTVGRVDTQGTPLIYCFVCGNKGAMLPSVTNEDRGTEMVDLVQYFIAEQNLDTQFS